MSYAHRENPAELSCFRACKACARCEDKGRYARCNWCSGRHDPELRRDPYDEDDHCRCTEGILQWRTQEGRFIQIKYPHNPFAGKVELEPKSQDELDWEMYLEQQRERFNDPEYDPITIDGKSATDWANENRRPGQ